MLDKEEELFALFKSADESGNGQIDAEELRRLRNRVVLRPLSLTRFSDSASFVESPFLFKRRLL